MSPSHLLFFAAALALSVPALPQEAPPPASEGSASPRPAPPAVALGRQEEQAEASAQGQPLPRQPSSRAATTAPAGDSLINAVAGLACWAMAAVVLLFGARMFFRRAIEGRGPSTDEAEASPEFSSAKSGPSTRLSDEGFWIDGGELAAGTRVLCRYFADGGERQVEVTLDARPGGQFIYTASRPLSVSVLVLGAAPGGGAEAGED